jgi:hypothetical protein
MYSTFVLDLPIWIITLLGNLFYVDVVYIFIGPAHMDLSTQKRFPSKVIIHMGWSNKNVDYIYTEKISE